jgi:exodeoxyribonuclease V gamma subunit
LDPDTDPSALRPGLLVLHGNRLERLAETVFAWLRAHPLGALEEEVFLVQSNGMAEWLKMELAAAQGVCAATRVELPARFLWRAYRALLGRAAVPAVSALDKLPLTWRLMGLLPRLLHEPGCEPLAAFLAAGAGDATRRLQLAQRLADLYDQYQVYRSDWLRDWADGRDRLRGPLAGASAPLPAEQAWQPALWRAVLAALDEDEAASARPWLHQRFLRALQAPDAGQRLPRRVVLFGTTHLPQQTLQAVAALAAHAQVLWAVPNPSRYHWADIIEGRELLAAAARRLPHRAGLDLAAVSLQDMHQHGHPLLAAWGRQGRDFVRQLDAHDDAERARERFGLPRLDFFDEGPGDTLLQQVQARIRDLVPLHEHTAVAVGPADRSIVFHIAHSAQREVEVLHDQLLHLLAQPTEGRPLAPRDIVVMVPDIELFAPAVRAVFGQHGRGHPRHIPYGIADLRERGRHPLLRALEWLLRAPQQRYAYSELRDLLDVPAAARRFGLRSEDVTQLADWAAGAGVRWGLHLDQRSALGLQACGDANSWRFGLQRMLLGYATGELPEGHAGIEPYAEVAGLAAHLAGVLAELLQMLDAWWADTARPRAPEAWGARLRTLVACVFTATDDAERALLSSLDDALAAWLEACDAAAFDEPVDIAVVREAWLDGIDEPAAPGGSRRFRAGGVTFCTLLPLRAIPFQVVCLLGMNEGDYPRRGARSDFDLMALPGQARPGDRSRRDDDRQLMLDALLSARRLLYVSWAGRSVRDNEEQPPSVLVSQLRDYLAAGWGKDVVTARSIEHPLQPFGRRYFEQAGEARDAALFTYASEWRPAHEPPATMARPALVAATGDAPVQIDIAALARFMRNPVKAWFRQRLRVAFDDLPEPVDDDEVFATAGLDRWRLMDEVLRAAQAPGDGDTAARVDAELRRLRRAGRLPLAGPGERVQAGLAERLKPMLAHWRALRVGHPQAHGPHALWLVQDGAWDFDDMLVGLRAAGPLGDCPDGPPLWLELQAGKLARGKKKLKPRAEKLLPLWLRSLAAAACGVPVHGVWIGEDAVAQAAAPDAAAALATLRDLLAAAAEGLAAAQPWPTAVLTGLAWLGDAPERARQVFEGGEFVSRAEGSEPCLARLFPDFAALSAAPGFEAATQRLYVPYRDWLGTRLRLEALPGTDDDEEDGGDGS